MYVFFCVCSAGVGRTGTFITIDFVLEKMEQEGVVDIIGTVAHMRHQRMKMVNTSVSWYCLITNVWLVEFGINKWSHPLSSTQDQFVFICKSILELVACGNTEIGAKNVRQEISKLSTVDPSTGKSGFQKQFDVSDKQIDLFHDTHIRAILSFNPS